MLILGVLCLAYYAGIAVLLKRWNFTFGWFWILAGVFCLFLHMVGWKTYLPALLVCLAAFLAVELRIVLGMFSDGEKKLSYLIVLGAQVRGQTMSGSLYRRVERAWRYLEENPGTFVILSGGQGEGEDITEAEAMRRYLAAKGIDAARILLEEKSTTTEENLKFSALLVKDKGLPVGIVSNNFHLYRACQYAKRQGYREVYPVTASCQPFLFVNYMVREAFAVVKLWFSRT